MTELREPRVGVADAPSTGAPTPITADQAARPVPNPRRRLVLLGLPVALYLLVAAIGPAVVPYDPVATDTASRLLAPGSETAAGTTAWLGTDQLGRDLLAQTIQGARVSILVGLVTVFVSGSFGLFVGVVAGYRGGWIDAVMSRLADIQLAFPSILLAILIASVLGPSLVNVIVTLSLTGWVFFARVARSAALSTRGRDFVDASRVLGAKRGWILRNDILPATVSPMLIVATLEFGSVIIAESSLSFLGLGSPVSTPSWGLTIANGRDYLDTAWWISVIPGIALTILMLSIGKFGDSLRDHLDPTLRGRR